MTKSQDWRSWVCTDCKIGTDCNARQIDQHLKSKKHKKNQIQASYYVCPDCKVHVNLNGGNIVQHINKHKLAVKSDGNKVILEKTMISRNLNANRGRLIRISPVVIPLELRDMDSIEGSSISSRTTIENKQWRIGSPSVLLKYVQTLSDLKLSIQCDPILSGQLCDSNHVCAVDCEGVPESLDLVQIATKDAVYVFDCVTLQPEVVCEHLRSLLESPNVIKILHDLHNDVVALQKYGITMNNVLDSQLVAEFAWNDKLIGMNDMLRQLELEEHPSKSSMKKKMRENHSIWKKRPLDKDQIEYAALDAHLLLLAYPKLQKIARGKNDALILASLARAKFAICHEGKRSVCFDKAHEYRMSSRELLDALRPGDVCGDEPVKCESSIGEVIDLLPVDLKDKLLKEGEPTDLTNTSLSDIVLDIGRRPWCWVDTERIMLSDDEERNVTKTEVDSIVDQLGKFGTDNRAGLEEKLHRISCMRDRNGEIIGLTIRVGRWFRGNATMLVDILLGSEKSVLFLGVPGSGKTTIVRETVRILADHHNVCVVDTSNEIGGDGAVPHPCIGLARRMMVPSIDAQSHIMIECVQNHTPHVMVIDEIGRPREVEAARTVKQRGVRIIASAHGSLRSLMKNKELKGLLGNFETVTLGDAAAEKEAHRKGGANGKLMKTQTQRIGEPTFDVIVEVSRGKFNEWRVVKDAGRAVDNILDGDGYFAEMRIRDSNDGAIVLELTQA